MLLAGGGAILICIVWLASNSPNNSQPASTDSAGRAIPASITNDAELLIYRCGKPDTDYSGENEVPRPLIPPRLITYKKAHLRFAYIPGGDSKVGDPPPYKWKVVGVVDTKTEKAIKAGNLETTLRARLPCVLGGTEEVPSRR